MGRFARPALMGRLSKASRGGIFENIFQEKQKKKITPLLRRFPPRYTIRAILFDKLGDSCGNLTMDYVSFDTSGNARRARTRFRGNTIERN